MAPRFRFEFAPLNPLASDGARRDGRLAPVCLPFLRYRDTLRPFHSKTPRGLSAAKQHFLSFPIKFRGAYRGTAVLMGHMAFALDGQ